MSVASPLRRLIAAHWALAPVCALFLLVAAMTLDDYGVWTDEPYQRAIGNATLDYLAGDGERAFEQVRHPTNRYYGAVFEAPLALVERIPGLADGWNLYLVRHLLTHLSILTGGVFCYLLALRLFGSRPLAIVAMLLFLLHPRIYAHSFFNSKDVPFLATFMIALWLAHRAFRRDTLAAFLLCGVGVGLLANLRIMGVLLFAAVLALRALDLALAGSAEARKRALLTGGAFALAALLTYYGSLPALWTDPVGRFAEMARTLGTHLVVPYNLFRGEWLYAPDGPPLDYVPVWVGITTPPAVLLLALAGAVALAWRALRRPRDVLRDGPLRFGLLLLILPVVAVAAVVALEGNVYHDWRQLYFLYAPLLLLAAFGLHGIMAFVRGPWPRAGTYALAGAAIAVALVSMVRIHPYQDNHFNVLTDRTTPERLISRYDMSHRWNHVRGRALAGILEEHPSGNLFIALNSGYFESRPLPPGAWERIVATRDFRSGERNFLEPHARQPCPASPLAVVAAARVYANTLYCVADPVVWLGHARQTALATEASVRSVYDIRRDGRQLTYVRDECPREDVEPEADGPRYFLHAVPRDASGLPPWRREHGFDNLGHVLRTSMARIDGDCVGVVLLPAYPIAAIRTGQLADDGILWEADVVFGDGAPDYAAARRDALAKEPLARSIFDVHRVGRTLTYLRDGCTEAEADARFFLHVVPADAGDLPEYRERYGFENLDFTLAARGARIDGNCVAVVSLPDYPVATVRTGQYDGTGALWTAEFALPDGE